LLVCLHPWQWREGFMRLVEELSIWGLSSDAFRLDTTFVRVMDAVSRLRAEYGARLLGHYAKASGNVRIVPSPPGTMVSRALPGPLPGQAPAYYPPEDGGGRFGVVLTAPLDPHEPRLRIVQLLRQWIGAPLGECVDRLKGPFPARLLGGLY